MNTCPAKTLPDPSVTIDMWVTHDAKTLIEQGHNVINSSDGQTYIVPGAHYYGVNNRGIYNNWEPWKISSDASKNPSSDDPHLLGGKLHVWNDQGPTGYDMTEIASLALPSLQVFAEKLWGTKGSKDYADFQKRAALTLPVPGVTVFDRIPVKKAKSVILDLPDEHTLDNTNSVMPLSFSNLPRCDLEWPWTLTMQVCKTAETGTRGVILSSASAEVCSDYTRVEERKSKDADGKEIKTKVTQHGIGVVRAAGSPGIDPASSRLVNDVSRVFSEALPLNQWVTITVIGNRGHTTVYLDGVKTGESDNQTLCPLAGLGSGTGNSFVGKIRKLKVYDRALSPEEISRLTGLDLPGNLAAGALSITASSEQPGNEAANAMDGDEDTRWCAENATMGQWLKIDLGQLRAVAKADISWEFCRRRLPCRCRGQRRRAKLEAAARLVSLHPHHRLCHAGRQVGQHSRNQTDGS